MTRELEEIAKRLAARERFEWRGGARGYSQSLGLWFRLCVPYPGNEGDWDITFDDNDSDYLNPYHLDAYPDLEDPATQGVLWAMLLEAAPYEGPGFAYSAIRQYRSGMVSFDKQEEGGGWKGYSYRSVGEALLEVWGES